MLQAAHTTLSPARPNALLNDLASLLLWLAISRCKDPRKAPVRPFFSASCTMKSMWSLARQLSVGGDHLQYPRKS